MIITQTNATPVAEPHTAELTASLNELLNRFVNLLAETGNAAWGKSDEDLVRRARTALLNVGHDPKLGHETIAHLDYAVLDGSA